MRKIYSLVLMAAALLLGTNAWAVNITSRSELQSFLTTAGTNTGVIAANLDLTDESVHFVVAGTKELTINNGVTLSLESAYTEQEEEQPNGYDGHGFCFYVQDGAKLTVKGNGTIAADRSVFFVEEGGELIIGEASKTSQLNVTTSVSNVKQRMVVAKGVASLYNANMSGRSGAIWSSSKLLIDGGTYLAKSSSTDNVAPLTAQYTYAVNAQGYSVILKNATIKGVHGGVAPAAGGHVEVDNCTLIADKNFADNPSGASSYYGLYGATYAICIVRNSKIYSSNGYSIYIGNNDSQHTFGLVYLYENCYLHGSTAAKAYPLVQKRQKTDYDILFPIEIAPTSAWYTVADQGSNSTDRRMPLPSNVEYLAKDTVIDGLTYQLRTVSTIPAENQEELAPTTEETIPWQEQTTWASNDVPDNETAVTIPEGKAVVVDNTQAQKTATANQVNLSGEGASLTVQEGTTLNVTNNMNIAVGAKLVVDAGAIVKVGAGGVISASEDAIEVKTEEGKSGIFMINPAVTENTHPMAMVQLTSKGYKRGENDYVWQRFGVPAWASTVKRSDVTRDNPAALTAMYSWNYGTAEWLSMPDEDTFVPFQCYQMTTTLNTPGTVYTFPASLMGNGNATLEFRSGFNFYANSYTAPIDLTQLVSDLSVSHPTQISGAIYVYRESDDWWDVISFADIDDYRNGIRAIPQISIEPMQAFVLQLREGSSDEAQINYETNIWDFVNRGQVTAPVTSAPARLNANSNSSYVMITVKDNNSDHSEEIVLRESNNFSENFDNGYDVEKMMNDKAFNFFATTDNGNMVQLATDELEGQLFSMTTKNETSFTMTFSNTRGTEYAMKDMMTNVIIPMTDGASYTFTTMNNATIDGRFQIVSINHVVTNMETVSEAASKTSGIYSIMGQYLGETSEWNNLPAGIYVIDGVKVVK